MQKHVSSGPSSILTIFDSPNKASSTAEASNVAVPFMLLSLSELTNALP
jgi:hypothetical protein